MAMVKLEMMRKDRRIRDARKSVNLENGPRSIVTHGNIELCRISSRAGAMADIFKEV